MSLHLVKKTKIMEFVTHIFERFILCLTHKYEWALAAYRHCAVPCRSVTKSCPTLCHPMDCSPPGSSSMGFSRQQYWSGLPFPSPAVPVGNIKESVVGPELERKGEVSTVHEALSIICLPPCSGPFHDIS